jgi:hypothetical protein
MQLRDFHCEEASARDEAEVYGFSSLARSSVLDLWAQDEITLSA